MSPSHIIPPTGVIVTKPLLFIVSLSLGCAVKDSETDSGMPTAESEDAGDICAGDKKTARVNGRDISEVGDPRVGDEWSVLMVCDGTIMMGAYVLRFTPPDVAVVDSVTNDVVFVQEGTTTMMLQVGNRKLEHSLTVGPAS